MQAVSAASPSAAPARLCGARPCGARPCRARLCRAHPSLASATMRAGPRQRPAGGGTRGPVGRRRKPQAEGRPAIASRCKSGRDRPADAFSRPPPAGRTRPDLSRDRSGGRTRAATPAL